jgi:AAA+ superfamily predicted ATPase
MNIQGLIILLHGPPGVGKTLTAETIAEYTQKPLFPINIGELTAEDRVVSRLRKIFEQAARWDAVLLLDEADVILEKRSYEDLRRNGIVSGKMPTCPKRTDIFSNFI